MTLQVKALPELDVLKWYKGFLDEGHQPKAGSLSQFAGLDLPLSISLDNDRTYGGEHEQKALVCHFPVAYPADSTATREDVQPHTVVMDAPRNANEQFPAPEELDILPTQQLGVHVRCSKESSPTSTDAAVIEEEPFKSFSRGMCWENMIQYVPVLQSCKAYGAISRCRKWMHSGRCGAERCGKQGQCSGTKTFECTYYCGNLSPHSTLSSCRLLNSMRIIV